MDQQKKWRVDPVAFAQEACTPRGCEPGWRLSAYQAAALRRLLGQDAAHTTAWIWPKRSGKTNLAAIAAVWISLFGGRDLRSLYLSTSERNAQTALFDATAYIIQGSRDLVGLAEVGAWRIRFDLTGSTIETVPNTIEAVTGIGINFLVSDELWASHGKEEPFHLCASQTELGRLLVISQAAGFKSYVRRIWELAQEGQEGDGLHVDYFEPTAEVASPNPALTADFLAMQRRELPEVLYRSYFENLWREGAGAAFTQATIEIITADYGLPRTARDWTMLRQALGGGSWVIGSGLDRALPHSRHGDRTAYATIGRRFGQGGEDQDQYHLLGLQVLPTGQEAEVVAAHKRAQQVFGDHDAIFESYQAADLVNRCQRAELKHATAPAQATMFDLLYRLVAEGRFHVSSEAEDLLSELQDFAVESGGESDMLPRWGALGSAHDDTVYAAVWALAVTEAAKHEEVMVMGPGGGPVMTYDGRFRNYEDRAPAVDTYPQPPAGSLADQMLWRMGQGPLIDDD